MKIPEKSHNTHQEKVFIDGIGTFVETQQIDRAILLERYINAASNREKWGDVNRDEVINHAVESLLNERQKTTSAVIF